MGETTNPSAERFNPFHRPVSAQVIRAVAAAWGLLAETLVGRTRISEYDKARVAIYLLLRDRGWSYPKIGRAMRGRNHSTIVSGVRRAQHLFETDPDWRHSFGMAKVYLKLPATLSSAGAGEPGHDAPSRTERSGSPHHHPRVPYGVE